MVKLHLVRHARSAQDPTRPSWEWTLADGARSDIERLRASSALPENGLWVSSSETKAVSTARLLTSGLVHVDDGLREAVRDPAWLGLDEFHRLVRESFAEPERSVRTGWEPLAVTQARVVRSARLAVSQADGRDVVLVGHGTAWTMLVAGLTGGPPDVAAWQGMRMPDHCVVEWPDRVATPWGSWDA